MPEVGETGWGNLVSNNFEILDAISNTFNTQIDTINENLTTLNLATASGTRVLVIPLQNPTTITTSNFSNYASYVGNNVYIASFGGNITFSSIPKPPHSCRLMIIIVNGNATISGNIDTYPTTLQSETPPNSISTNTYKNNINLVDYYCYKITLTYTANQNNSILNMNQQDYLNFINNTIPDTLISTTQYSLSIPHAIAAGGSSGNNGTAGTATNTCNGGGGGVAYRGTVGNRGGTGCIFGQYEGGKSGHNNGYGYGDVASNKYRCGLVIIVNGNLAITGTITQNGGKGSSSSGSYGGYGGGAYYFENSNPYPYGGYGGGGAPVFIYYTGKYTNNGSINVNGGNCSYYEGSSAGFGGAGGIKTTKITL